MSLAAQFRCMVEDGDLDLPFPGCGNTAARHLGLAQIARDNLALARLAEAHADAVAILHEAGREARPRTLYGVWASEFGAGLRISEGRILGEKKFCSGAGIVDRALVTTIQPERRLIEIDLRAHQDRIRYDHSEWITAAFADTQTGTTTFQEVPIEEADFIGPAGWYLERPGFWHGACGPAACWAGGALGLIDYAVKHTRDTNGHALAHLGAMHANRWLLQAALRIAGDEIDRNFDDVCSARMRAFSVRHLIEQCCADTLLRFGRALGPRPLAFEIETTKRCQELTLYIRQSHAESDLEALGRDFLTSFKD